MPEFVTGEMKYTNGRTILNVVSEAHAFTDFNGHAWSLMLRPGQSKLDPSNETAVWLGQLVNHTTGWTEEFEARDRLSVYKWGILLIGYPLPSSRSE